MNMKTYNTNNTAFVIGNGKSREGFDLIQLREWGKSLVAMLFTETLSQTS